MQPSTHTYPHHDTLSQLNTYLQGRIIGQPGFLLRLLIALLANGHLLVEGVPGLAKTLAIKELASVIDGDFHRIQFTPDLLPADVTGNEIYHPHTASFSFSPGPIFHNLLLADEINRAPAKVQSALLEAMAEQQVTIGRVTYKLPNLFLVMATQNPLEHDGTYPLPEAQLDRFLMYVKINYPAAEDEHKILRLARDRLNNNTTEELEKPKVTQEIIFDVRKQVNSLYISEALEKYIVELVVATRNPKPYSAEWASLSRYGASPRATIDLDRCARAHAWLAGRDYVTPEDIHAIAHDVLRHRILLSYEAQAQDMTTDDFITTLLQRIAIP